MHGSIPCTQHLEAGMFIRRRRGSSAASRLVCIHGLGESGLCFDSLLSQPALADHELIILDLPGYGRSAWPSSPPSLSDLASHLAGWIASLERGPEVIVLGHSMGGVIATLSAEQRPQLAAGIINVDGNVSIGDCSYSSVAAAQSEEDFVAAGFAALQECLFEAGDRASRGYFASMRFADPRSVHRHGVELVALSKAENLAARLAAVATPHCYVAGVPGGAAARSRALLAAAGVDVIAIEPAGHWPFIDQPARFAEQTAAWLARLPQR